MFKKVEKEKLPYIHNCIVEQHNSKKAKSEDGFTMQDLIIAIFIITLFVGIVGSLMFSVYKASKEADLMLRATAYSVQILEDIDKIAYEEVNSNLASTYRNKFSIPEGYNINLEVTNYGEENNLEDVMKIVKLTISFQFQGEEQNISITRLKIKEI